LELSQALAIEVYSYRADHGRYGISLLTGDGIAVNDELRQFCQFLSVIIWISTW